MSFVCAPVLLHNCVASVAMEAVIEAIRPEGEEGGAETKLDQKLSTRLSPVPRLLLAQPKSTNRSSVEVHIQQGFAVGMG